MPSSDLKHTCDPRLYNRNNYLHCKACFAEREQLLDEGPCDLVLCLYCDRRMSRHRASDGVEKTRRSICHKCMRSPARDEARELAAGMRPWAK